MNKILTLMLGLSLVLGATGFAQTTDSTSTPKTKKHKRMKKMKKTDSMSSTTTK